MKEERFGTTVFTLPLSIAINPDLTNLDKWVWWIIDLLSVVSKTEISNKCMSRLLFFCGFKTINPTTISAAISKLKKLGLLDSDGFDGRVRKATSHNLSGGLYHFNLLLNIAQTNIKGLGALTDDEFKKIKGEVNSCNSTNDKEEQYTSLNHINNVLVKKGEEYDRYQQYR